MTKDQLLGFLDAVNTDSGLQEQLKEAVDPHGVAAIAQSAGYGSVSAELVTDFLEYVAAQAASAEESDQELLAVSGGMSARNIALIATGSVAGAAVVGLAGYYAYSSQGTQYTTTSDLDSSVDSSEWSVDHQGQGLGFVFKPEALKRWRVGSSDSFHSAGSQS